MPNAQSRSGTATPASLARRRRPQHREFPTGYSLAGCSPAEPASASPAAPGYGRRPSRHNQHRCPHFVSPMGSISRSRNQHTACHSRAPSRQRSETKHFRRGPFFPPHEPVTAGKSLRSLQNFDAAEAWIPAFRRDSERGNCQFFISDWILAQPPGETHHVPQRDGFRSAPSRSDSCIYGVL
jgi:hypothetical protein